ncbi:D-ribose-binding protein [Lentibacillus sp. JNUCC-1]|uniref:substrate-binding domain-containing protein n=1 Tax=Lentibacillus sp. JNUCC-1 TaxID=2654513 RepID=UPI0012E8DB6D|nr:substrate-binding domain-containing protein [Lentibacillus sp. JNUCC-1]MUV37186.1 D-ribose-binding protein [Lentibacillus sp. JNUCC-1]
MTSRKSIVTIILMLIIATITSACSLFTTTNKEVEGADITDKVANLKMGLSMSAQDNDFLKETQDLAKKNAKEAKYEMITSNAENDAGKQKTDINNMLDKDIDVLIINPVDSDKITEAIKAANDADIPVVTIIEKANGGKVTSHITPKNPKAEQSPKLAKLIAGNAIVAARKAAKGDKVKETIKVKPSGD